MESVGAAVERDRRLVRSRTIIDDVVERPRPVPKMVGYASLSDVPIQCATERALIKHRRAASQLWRKHDVGAAIIGALKAPRARSSPEVSRTSAHI